MASSSVHVSPIHLKIPTNAVTSLSSSTNDNARKHQKLSRVFNSLDSIHADRTPVVLTTTGRVTIATI